MRMPGRLSLRNGGDIRANAHLIFRCLLKSVEVNSDGAVTGLARD